MKLEQFAELRNLTVTKVKKICKNILGTIPTTLTDEQIQTLDSHLAASSQALLPQSEQEQSDLIPSILSIPEERIDKIIETVGVSVLKKNAALYRSLLQQTFSETLIKTAEVCQKTEETQAQLVAQTYENMSRNLAAVYHEMNVPVQVSAEKSDFLSQEEKDWLLIELKMLD